MPIESLIGEVEKYLRRTCRVRETDRVLVGLSGGPDSVALTDVLRRLQSEVTAGHINHRMRGAESDEEEQFVRRLTERWGVALHVRHLTESPSSEEEARDARLGELCALREEVGAQVVALGHHRDDQAETVLLNLLRGAGMRGLRGILPRRGAFVHPLLEVSRKDILAYLRAAGLKYCIDSSNRRPDFQRNRIRLELMPYLQEHFNPRIHRVLARSAEILRAEEAFAASEAKKHFRRTCAGIERGGDGRIVSVRLTANTFRGLPLAVQRRVLRLAASMLTDTEENLHYANIRDALQLVARRETGALLHLPAGLVLSDDGRGHIYLEAGDRVTRRDWSPAVLPIPGQLMIPGVGRMVSRILSARAAASVRSALMSPNPPSLVSHAFIDYNKVDLPIWTRRWRAGDRMRPLGFAGSKKIQDLFVDEKIPRRRRGDTPLILCRDTIAWVVGVRLAEDYRVDGGTKQILHLWFDHTWPRSHRCRPCLLPVEEDENEMDPDLP